MRRRQTRAPEQFVAQRSARVRALQTLATLQFRYDELDEVRERLRHDGRGKVEAVDTGLVDPAFEFVRDLCRRSDDEQAAAADPAARGQFAASSATIVPSVLNMCMIDCTASVFS